MKVLVYSSDILPLEGLPTSGGGLRSWQLIQGLKCHGFDVDFSMPGEDRFLEREYRDRIPEQVRKTSWYYDRQDEIVEMTKPEAIIFANPDLNYLKKNYDIPIVSDIHGPRLIEFDLLTNDGSFETRGKNIRRKITNILRSDFFCCAGRWQRYYFLAFFLMAGYRQNEVPLAFVPVSLSPELPEPDKDLKEKRFIFSGGFYPWQDPTKGLYNLSDVLRQENEACLHIFGGTHHTSGDDTRKFERLKNELNRNERINFRGYLTRDDLIEEYRTGYVAVELFKRNFEREIAFTTRTVEFLWAGLPVIYNNYSDLSGYIRDYRAGWCVDPENTEEVSSAMREAIHEPEKVLEYGRNAQKLVRDCFTWDKTITPVVDFLKNPCLARRTPDIRQTPVPYILNEEAIQGFDAQKLGSLIMENSDLKEELEWVYNSRSWKWAETMKKYAEALRGIKRKIGF